MSSELRLKIGVLLLIIGLIAPLGVYPIVQSDLPVAAKTIIGGIVAFSFELLAIPAVAIMGKENFNRIMKCVSGWFGRLKPSARVGRLRYNIGLVMFVLPIVPTYVMAYFPKLLPDCSPERLLVNIGADVVFLLSLFILGGEFWDKLRSLFVWRARAVFLED